MSTNKNPAILHTNQQDQQYSNQLFQQHAYIPRGVDGYQLSQQHTFQAPPGAPQQMPQLPNTIRSNPQQQQQQQDVKMQPLAHTATHRYTIPNQNTYRSSQQPQVQPTVRVSRPQQIYPQNPYVLQHSFPRFFSMPNAQYMPGMQPFYPVQTRPPYMGPGIQPHPQNLVPSTPPPLQQTLIPQMPGPAVAPINQTKSRSRAVKIINPDTKEEVKVGNDDSSVSTNDETKHIHIEKHYENDTNYMTEYNPYVDSQTPVVSAMSDGPSVEIQKVKKKKKIIEVNEPKQMPCENVDEEFNSGNYTVLQTTALEFQPSKPPPILKQTRDTVSNKDEEQEEVTVTNDDVVDNDINNDVIDDLNHGDDIQDDYVHVDVDDVKDDVVHSEPEIVPVTVLSTDETDKSINIAIPDELEMKTDLVIEKQPQTVAATNIEEFTKSTADMSLESISSDESICKDKIEEPIVEVKPQIYSTLPKQLQNSLANTGFGNAIMEEMKSGHITHAAVEQRQQQQDPPIRRPMSKSQTLLTYEQGQWSPTNSDGKKFYNREQMLALRAHPASQTQPACELGVIAASKYTQQSGGGNYNKQMQRQNSGYGKRPSQNSQQSGMGNANKGSKTGIIHLSLSLREDVKLNETENAWKPTFNLKDGNDSTSNEVLYKRVRGVLNKLTPEKFDTLLEQIKSFNIDTPEKLQGVIELVFEKAIDEPNFSKAYAQLCSKLSEKATDTESKLALFKKSLISKCQNEFQNHVTVDESKLAEKLQPFLQKVQEATDPDRKAEFQANFEEEERKLRRRSVGTVRFIGELFKMGMLTHGIMLNCVGTLLDRNSEEKLECLCKLLTTIGDRLDEKKNLHQTFNSLREIVDKKNQNSKISSRVRFMIQDVIDLRKNSWVPRREANDPKKMGQIQKEADAEQTNIQLLNMNVNIGTRRDDRGGGNRGSDRGDRDRTGGFNQKSGRSGNTASEDGWMPSSSKSRSLIDHSKFKFKNIDDSTSLGTPNQFKWSGVGNTTQTTTQITNSFLLLDGTRSGSMGGSKDYSKGSIERATYDSRGGNNSRSGSQHGSRENSVARSSLSLKPVPPRAASQSMYVSSTPRPSLDRPQQSISIEREERSEPDDNTRVQIKRIANEILQYHNRGEMKLEMCHLEVETIPEKYRWAIVHELFNSSVDNHQLKSSDRVFAGQAVCVWITRKLINTHDNIRALKEFLEPVLDLVVDIPMVWMYIAEFITPVIKQNYLSLKQIRRVCAEEHVMEEILKKFIPYALTEYGPHFVRNLFKECEWHDLISNDEFVSECKFEFVKDNSVSLQRKGATNIDLITQRVKEFLQDDADESVIHEFIEYQCVPIDKTFIWALSTVVAEDFIDKKLPSGSPTGIKLLLKYIDDIKEWQLNCLNAIHSLIHNLQYPANLIKRIFSLLYDEDVVSKKVFVIWRDTDLTEGKGIAVPNLKSFYDHLEKQISSEEENN